MTVYGILYCNFFNIQASIKSKSLIMAHRKLYRSRKEKVLAGVAGGIGEYFDFDPVIARVIFVILTFFGGGGLLVYVVLWIALPEKPLQAGENNIDDFVVDVEEVAEESIKCIKKGKNFSIVLAVILIALGVTLLLDQLNFIVFRNMWPVILVVAGVFLLLRSFDKK